MLSVHGSGGTSTAWNAQLTRLDGGRAVTAIDPSGRERSTGPWLTS